MYSKSLFAVAFAFCASTSAAADDVSYRAQIRFAAGEQAQVMVPMPDARRGAPDSMEVQLLVSLRGFAAIENISKSAGGGVLVTGFGANLSTGNGQLAVDSGGSFVRMAKFGSFDGAVDYKGASSAFFEQNEMGQRGLQVVSGKQLESILASNRATGLRFNVNSGASASLLGLESAIMRTNLYLTARVVVTYRYDDAPTKKPSGKGPAAPGNPSKAPLAPGKQSVSLTAIVSNKG